MWPGQRILLKFPVAYKKKESLCASLSYGMLLISSLKFRLETLNEKRSGIVQMVKLAEKERDNLEVRGRLS